MGQSMAYFEIRLAIAALVLNYVVSADDGVDGRMRDGDMEMTDHFIYIPKGGRCWLRFEKMGVGGGRVREGE